MALSAAPTAKQATGEHLTRRTFAIISHPDAGKTTLSEKLLLAGGAIHLAGEVKARGERRRARSDWMKIEQARGISVTTSVMTFDFGDLRLNLLDTPGHDDFSEDTYRTLTAVDCAIMVIDAAKGIEAQTRKLFEVCRLRDVPIVTFINKIDREGRDPFELMDEIADQLALDTSPITWPIGMGLDFRGVHHLLDEARVQAALPAAALRRLREEAELAREACPAFDLDSFRAGHLTPVFFGSALRNFGVDHLLDGLARYAPPPLPRPAVSRAVAPDEAPLTGFVFKVQANMDPKHRDRVAFVRLCSGRFARGMKLNHVRSGKTMAVYNPIFFFARERALTEAAVAGDIIGVPNHGSLRVGDTLTEGEALQFTGIPNFAPEILRRVRLGDPMKAKHLRRALEDLAEEGVAHVFRPLIGSDWIVGVVGPLQLDVLAERIGADYNVNVDFEAAPYETARWVVAPDGATEKRFIDANRAAIGEDRDGAPVFLARNAWALGRAGEDWPDVKLLATRERH